MNSKVTLVLRILLGLILVIFGANKFYPFMPAPTEMSEGAMNFMGALGKSGYMFPLIGGVEVIVGLLLLLKKWVPFALILLAPVAVNMVLFHLVLEPGSTAPALAVLVINAILIYANWDKFKTLFN
ncbi:DoxX family membrane protein [Aureibaculum algae]|uniref:DoxX family membrane protein n=1 Tax=Aureibaculum algae TaxID=2584122 RepID=A0A5B7TT35_9FLAO|nr:DoxX family membrane protein [Aureibaculum algae]QCX37762.1 DoxX family membrane protein [Aureibaculum algae]